MLAAWQPQVSAEAHPPQGSIEKLFRGELQGVEKRAVVRHLLGGCPACLELAALLLDIRGRRR